MQQALYIPLRKIFRADNFIWQERLNEQVYHSWLQHLDDSITQQLFISGKPASGKSHLLLASAIMIREKGCSVQYIDIDQSKTSRPDDSFDVVIIDNFQRVLLSEEQCIYWVEWLDFCWAKGVHLLIGCQSDPAYALLDCYTRLHRGSCLQLPVLQGKCLSDALRIHVDVLGLSIPQNLQNALLKHFPRPEQLFNKLQELDSIQMSASKRLTSRQIEALLL